MSLPETGMTKFSGTLPALNVLKGIGENKQIVALQFIHTVLQNDAEYMHYEPET